MSSGCLTLENAASMADLHARAFPPGQAWTAKDFTNLLTQSAYQAYGVTQAEELVSFILIQIAADQAEILTLATDPDRRRKGLAASLLGDVEDILATKAISKWFLDVGADNPGAIAFYENLGFQADGRRPGYYKRLEGTRVDAILMSKTLGGQALR